MLSNKNIPTTFIALIACLTLVGCASFFSPHRDAAASPKVPCAEKPQSHYVASSKSDPITATILVNPLVFSDRCNSISGFSCKSLADVWMFAMPLAAADLPFALVTDLYRLPADHRYRKARATCVDAPVEPPHKPSTAAASPPP